MDARSFVETLCAGNYEADHDQPDPEDVSREKLYFQTNPPAGRSGKISEIRNPLPTPYLRHPATRFRVARTLCPPANEPTAVGSPGPIPARRDGGDDDLGGHSIADFGLRIADWGSSRRSACPIADFGLGIGGAVGGQASAGNPGLVHGHT